MKKLSSAGQQSDRRMPSHLWGRKYRICKLFLLFIPLLSSLEMHNSFVACASRRPWYQKILCKSSSSQVTVPEDTAVDEDVSNEVTEVEEMIEEVARISRKFKHGNQTLTEVIGEVASDLPGTTLGPSLASCFVESWESSREVLEEWYLKDEPRSIRTFRHWRQHSDGPVNIRCEAVPPIDLNEVTCLECLSVESSLDPGLEHAQVLSTTSLQNCLAGASHSLQFCRHGTVSADG